MKRFWTLTILTGFISLGAVGRDLILAYRLGNNAELNEFLQCTILPIFAITFFTANLPVLFVPRLIGMDATVMSRFLRLAVRTTLVASSTLLLFSAMAGYLVESWFFLTSKAQYLLWMYFALSSLSATFRSFHNANESYTGPLIASLAGSITTATMFWFFAAHGKNFLAAAYLLGALVELALTSWRYRHVITQRPADYPAASWKSRFNEVLPLLITGFFIPLGPMVDQIFAAAIDNKGLSFLLYAGKFWGLVMGTMGTVIGTVALTEFSKSIASSSVSEVEKMLKRGSVHVFSIGLIASVLIWILAPYLVPLVFERGEFTRADSLAVTEVVRFGIWILPPYFVAYYLKRYLMALRVNKIITIIYGSNIILNALADLILSQYFGIAGIALSSAVVQVWSAAWTIFAINRLRGKPLPKFG